MVSVCGGDAPPPATAVKVMPVEESTIRCGTAFTVSVTGTTVCCPPEVRTVIWPLYVPGASFPGSTVTLMGDGATVVTCPLAAEMLSQLAPAADPVVSKFVVEVAL
jgi:hypothetical protein